MGQCEAAATALLAGAASTFRHSLAAALFRAARKSGRGTPGAPAERHSDAWPPLPRRGRKTSFSTTISERAASTMAPRAGSLSKLVASRVYCSRQPCSAANCVPAPVPSQTRSAPPWSTSFAKLCLTHPCRMYSGSLPSWLRYASKETTMRSCPLCRALLGWNPIWSGPVLAHQIATRLKDRRGRR